MISIRRILRMYLNVHGTPRASSNFTVAAMSLYAALKSHDTQIPNNNSSTSAESQKASLYASLTPSTCAQPQISSKPILYVQPEPTPEVAPQEDKKAAFRFQQVQRRPPSKKQNKQKTQIASVAQSAPSIQNITKLSDWTNDHEESYHEPVPRRQKKKRKKNIKPTLPGWDDDYDPSKPNDYEYYKQSDENIRESIDWGYKLIGRTGDTSDEEESEEDRRPLMTFAPPKQFADEDVDVENPRIGQEAIPQELIPPPLPVDIPMEESGEDAYARRLRLSGLAPHAAIASSPSYLPPIPSRPHISADPTVYLPAENPPVVPVLESASEYQSTRPGQKDFAKRLMSKYGWTPGTGLGASSNGIINPLAAKIDKGKKGSGTIIDRNEKSYEEKYGKFGKMNRVICLENVIEPGQVDEDLAGEIGGECEKYGVVERVSISEDGPEVKIFVFFVDQLAALQAVNSLNGRIFGGREIRARFAIEE
ncbi:DNA-damage-repair/toleration protein [Neolecta irregularis DAH-3]|uniref:DNA-damage-repair/toleration protein n=1 Tax=Neolecta irregularis (strain DAH-3) TaxID=1198029 RepID=A0A1U7LNV7_NEOID|nr:DNA-damage-repair/toleration protein [Neolecta irregularis DAH-3]|eukprot:OLL24319.1 DNA-damage-repair/toleration protein [Neolecta irregularis DAH-3]